MAPCNYIPLDTAHFGAPRLYLDDLFDLDILCTEEGIFINAYDRDETELLGTLVIGEASLARNREEKP
jgi:hypothetical protein